MMTPGPGRSIERSRTYPGIADAMADQWGLILAGGIEPSTERLTLGDQLTADTTQPTAAQADAESAEIAQ